MTTLTCIPCVDTALRAAGGVIVDSGLTPPHLLLNGLESTFSACEASGATGHATVRQKGCGAPRGAFVCVCGMRRFDVFNNHHN